MSLYKERRSLLRRRNVLLAWTAGVMAGTGGHVLAVVIPFVVYTGTGSPLATAVTVLAAYAPPILVSQLAGMAADRFDRRRILIAASLSLAVLTSGYLLVGGEAWWALAAVNAARSVALQFIGPAEHALLPDLVETDRHDEVAGLNALNNNLARLIGPALGGMLYVLVGFAATIMVNIAAFLVAAVLLLLIQHQQSDFASHDDAKPSLWKQWTRGIATVRHRPILRRLFLVIVLLSFGEGFLSALLVPFTHDMLHASADVLGWLLSAQAIGGIAGALWFTRMSGRYDPMHLLGWGSLSCGLVLAVVFTYPLVYSSYVPALVLVAVVGVPFAVVAAAETAILQTHVEAGQRGRVFALAWGLTSLVQVLGTLLAGLAAEQWGALVIIADAVLYLVAGIVAISAWRLLRGWTRRTTSDPGDDHSASAPGGVG